MLKLFQDLEVPKLGNLFYIKTLVTFIDVSKFTLVHFGEVLKDLNTKEDGHYKMGLDQKRVLVPYIFVGLAMKENIFNPNFFYRI